jgi:hypothetical protein
MRPHQLGELARGSADAEQGTGLLPQAATVRIRLPLTAEEFDATLNTRLRIGRP